MNWLVLAMEISTGTIYPYGLFTTRREAVEWSEGKFDGRYDIRYQWMRNP